MRVMWVKRFFCGTEHPWFSFQFYLQGALKLEDVKRAFDFPPIRPSIVQRLLPFYQLVLQALAAAGGVLDGRPVGHSATPVTRYFTEVSHSSFGVRLFKFNCCCPSPVYFQVHTPERRLAVGLVIFRHLKIPPPSLGYILVVCTWYPSHCRPFDPIQDG